MWADVTNSELKLDVSKTAKRLTPNSDLGAEFANYTCKSVGLAVGADYVRFVRDVTETGSVLVQGSWPEQITPESEKLSDSSFSAIEYRSIETSDVVEISTTVETTEKTKKDSTGDIFFGFAVPVADSTGIFGAIGVYFEHGSPDSGYDTEIVKVLASALAKSLRTINRADSSLMESSTWRTLAQIGRLASGSPKIEEAYNSVSTVIRSLIEYDSLTITLLDPDQQTLSTEFTVGTPLPEQWTQAPTTLLRTMNGEVLRSKIGLHVGMHNNQSFVTQFREAAELNAAGFRSWLIVPLMWQNAEIGLLSVLSKDPNVYNDAELKLLNQIGANISGALTSAQLYRTVREDAEERSIIAELSRTLSSSVQISEVYPLFTRQLKRLIPFDRITISLFHPNRGTVYKNYIHGVEVPTWDTGLDYPPGPLVDMVIRVGHGLVRNAGETYPEESPNPYEDEATSLGLLSALAVPLTVHNRPIGAMCLRSYEPRAFNFGKQQLAERVAEQIAGSMLAFQYHSALNEQINETALLEKYVGEALSSKTIDAILDSTFTVASKVLRFDRMILGLTTPRVPTNFQLYERGIEVPGTEVAGSLLALNQDPINWAQGEFLPAYFGSVQEVPQLDSDHAQRIVDAGLTSWMHVPLVMDRRLQGYLAVQGRPRKGYEERHFRKLDRIGYLLSPVIRTVMPESSTVFHQSGGQAHQESGLSLTPNSIPSLQKPTKLLLVDDDPVYRAGLSAIFSSENIDLVGATDWSEADAQILSTRSDVVLAYAHGNDDDLSLMLRESHRHSSPPVLVILEDSNSDDALRYLKIGAAGIISRDATAHQIISAVEQLASGRSVVESHVLDLMIYRNGRSTAPMSSTQFESLQHITDRDREILRGVALGQTNSEIASDMNLAAGTVRNRLGNLFSLLDVPDRSAAVYASMRLGIID